MTETMTEYGTTGAIIDALRAFVKQAPGINPADYAGFSKGYHRDRRMATNDRVDALRMLDFIEGRVRNHGDFPADILFRSARSAYSGRLNIERVTRNGETGIQVYYTPGQMGALEFREAVAAVVANAIRTYWHEVEGHRFDYRGAYTHARNLFGRRIARNFFG